MPACQPAAHKVWEGMQTFHVCAEILGQEDPNNAKLARQYPNGGYCWRAASEAHDAYFAGRQANIYLQSNASSSTAEQKDSDLLVGKFGVIHPDVLSNLTFFLLCFSNSHHCY